MPVPTLRELWQDYRQWRLGNKRIGKYGSRGRVYAPRKPQEEAPVNVHKATTEPKGTISARVFRVGEGDEEGPLNPQTGKPLKGRWENLGVIAEPLIEQKE